MFTTTQKKLFKIFIVCVHICHSTCVVVRGQLSGVGSFFPSSVSQGLNSGCQRGDRCQGSILWPKNNLKEGKIILALGSRGLHGHLAPCFEPRVCQNITEGMCGRSRGLSLGASRQLRRESQQWGSVFPGHTLPSSHQAPPLSLHHLPVTPSSYELIKRLVHP